MDVVGVLPRLRQQPVVPVDVVGVEAQVALLDVLLDGRLLLILNDKSLASSSHTQNNEDCL